VEIACANTAYQWGLYPKKGAIQVGSDADLVILNMEKKVRVVGREARSRRLLDLRKHGAPGWADVTISPGSVIF